MITTTLVFFIFTNLFTNLAEAKPLQPGELPLVQVGAVANLNGCEAHVLANPWTTRNAGQMVIDQARAQSICHDSQGDLAIAQAKAQAFVNLSIAEATLIGAGAEPVKNGESVSYSRGHDGAVRLDTGSAAEWRAYGEALADGNVGMGRGIRGIDPRYANLMVLDSARAGFMNHPAVPAVARTSENPASCGALDQCEARVTALETVIAEQ